MAKVVTSVELADNLETITEDMHKNPDAYRGFPFPSTWFMKHTGGWGRDWLCYIYGKAGHGKSAVMNTAAVELGYKKISFLYVSLEESLLTLAQKAVANMGDINRTRFRDVTLQDSDWPNLAIAADKLRQFPGYWSEGLYDWDEMVATLLKINPLPDVILVDYLQLMHIKNSKNMTDTVAQASKKLAQLSKGNITGRKHSVIVAAQLNDNNEVLHSRDPDRDGDLIGEISKISNGSGGFLPDQRNFNIRKAKYGGQAFTNMAFFGARGLVGDLYGGPNYGPLKNPPVQQEELV